MVVVFIFGRCFDATFEVAIFIFLESPKSSLVIELGRTRTFVTFVKSRSDLAIFPFPSLFLWPFILVALFLLITRLIGYHSHLLMLLNRTRAINLQIDKITFLTGHGCLTVFYSGLN